MRFQTTTGAAVLLAAGLAAFNAEAQIHAEVHPAPGVVLQVISAFDNPEGAIFSADGKHVFVSNAAEIGSDRSDGFGWADGEGYISKLRVLDWGGLEMVEEKLIDNITAPLGMGVLPVSTEKFPAGTIFVCAGSAPMRDSDGNPVTDPNRLRTKLIAFNEDGDILGMIDTGTGSIFEEINGSPIVLINALGFDEEGNLYVADTAFGGGQFEPAIEGKGGLWRIPVDALDDLADGSRPSELPTFLGIPGNPDGVEVSPADGTVYVNTVGPVAGAPDPAGGGIYAIDDMSTLPAPLDSNLGALDGLDFTGGGTMINTQIKGDVPARMTVTCPDELSTTLELEPSVDLSGPADIAIRRADGVQLMVVPELTNRDPSPGDDQVTVVALPSHFDQACAQ